MLLACSFYRYDGKTHGCEKHGECKPIQAGPDLSVCGDFHNPMVIKKPVQRLPCVHLGKWTGDVEACKTCSGKVHLKVMECAIHGTCTIGKVIPGKACCKTCKDYQGQTTQ